MTSAELIDEHAGVKTIGTEKLEFSPSAVYNAASLVQASLLSKIPLVEKTIQLALVAGQGRYTFSPHVPTAAVGHPVTLTFGEDHEYHDGDEVVTDGIAEGFDGSYKVLVPASNQITLVNSPALSVPMGTKPIVYPALMAAQRIKDSGIIKVSSTTGLSTGVPLTKVTNSEFATYDAEFGNTSEKAKIINFMEEYTIPCVTLHFQGRPAEDILTKVTFYRRPLPCERITATIEPIMPFGYDDLFYLGVRYFLVRNLDEASLAKVKQERATLFFQEANAVARRHGISKSVFTDDITGGKW